MIRLTSFLWLWFQCVCLLMPSCNIYRLTWVSLTLEVGYLFTAAPAECSHCSLPWTRTLQKRNKQNAIIKWGKSILCAYSHWEPPKHLRTLPSVQYISACCHILAAILHYNSMVKKRQNCCFPADDIINTHLFSAGKTAAVDVVAF